MEYTFDEKALEALYLMEKTQANLFLTGKAGTGKSTLLRSFLTHTTKNIAVLAPTGVAALNIGGSTIHSFFKMSPKSTFASIRKEAKRFIGDPTFTELDAIVIDEISMMRADLFDFINLYLQIVCENSLAFGGKQMILIGDLFQLPPVVTSEERDYFRDNYLSPYFFSSKVVANGEFSFTFHELEKIYRQNDQIFIDILNSIREKKADEAILSQLNECVVGEQRFEIKPGDMYLAGRNSTVDELNREMLEALEGEEFCFPAEVKGRMSPSAFPTEEKLKLKVGAQVMFMVNDSAGRRANGTLGIVKEISREKKKAFVLVELFDGEEVEVSSFTWRVNQYTYDYDTKKLGAETVGSFSQIPLKLAWACTIHKSQGKTFENVVLDMKGGSFAHGQTYVALSRCKSLEGLKLISPIRKSDIILDSVISDFIATYHDQKFVPPLESSELYQKLEKAMKEKAEISILYQWKDWEIRERKIAPTKLGRMRLKGVVFVGMKAICGESGKEKVFEVERVKELKSGRG